MVHETIKPIIAPSVLAGDFACMGQECARMVKGEGADWLHMDVMDGHFVPAITFGHQLIGAVHRKLPEAYLDCHMMVSNPNQWIDDIAAAGGSSYTFHLEACKDKQEPFDLVKKIHSKNMKAAVAISPDTSADQISDKLGNAVDMILVMTVHPGKGGQSFIESCMDKVTSLRKRFPTKNIEVDGGVGPKTSGVCSRAGANVFVSGTAVFGHENPRQAMDGMRAEIEQAKSEWPQQ